MLKLILLKSEPTFQGPLVALTPRHATIYLYRGVVTQFENYRPHCPYAKISIMCKFEML